MHFCFLAVLCGLSQGVSVKQNQREHVSLQALLNISITASLVTSGKEIVFVFLDFHTFAFCHHL